ncbi:MAG: hypothetical protein GEU78_06835 [Actinobacteria bacterium]|nr:hypothetical protein [Actinomycetota bacterium]
MAEPPTDWRPLLGRKVSVRYALRGDPEHPFSEAIGMLGSVEGEGKDAAITIFTKRGESVRMRAADVLAAKVFPPAPG